MTNFTLFIWVVNFLKVHVFINQTGSFNKLKNKLAKIYYNNETKTDVDTFNKICFKNR